MVDVVTSPAERELGWYLIQCKPRQESRALENLERQGVPCYFPRRSVSRSYHGGRTQAPEALFPGYMFVRLDRVNDNWSSIRSTRGVHRIVGFDASPMRVRDEVIANIRLRLQEPGLERPYLSAGDRVLITEGAFSELEAIYVAAEGEQRVVILLTILQTEHRLSFPAHGVRKVV
jgi:transcriptional antiterminator RfaH